MDYCCWRCGHGLERTAVDCSGCGKALTPVTWFGFGKRPWKAREFTDVVAIDYMRRSFLKQMVFVTLLWLALVAVGAWVIHVSGDMAAKAAETHADVRADLMVPGAGGGFGEYIEALMKFQTVTLDAMRYFGWGLIGLASLGAYQALFSWFKVRRLLLAIPPVGEAPGPRKEP